MVLHKMTLRFLVLLGVVLTHPVHGALTIEITGGTQGAQPIAVVPFGWDGSSALPTDIAEIIAADLHRSGSFAPLPKADLISQPHEGSQINFADWRVLGSPNIVVGKIHPSGNGYRVQFQLFDVFKGTQITGYSMVSTAQELRRAAHQISDLIYETLTGQPGAFATRIAYITETQANGKRRYSLYVADADGYSPIPILHSFSPLMSPSWSPDGKRLAYVSFEHRRSEIYIHELATRQRDLVASSHGLNSAPTWSPDGERMALVLSKDGNPEIYVLNIKNKTLQRITNNPAIDTEPGWMPDGARLVFTSDRGGKPQIYQVAVNAAGKPQRLTFEGDYNAHGVVSPDGRSLVMVHGQGNHFRIAVQDLSNNDLRILTDTRLDESPSFAPNGAIIVYATEVGNRGVLGMVSLDGTVRQRLTQTEGDAREPAWGPRTHRIKP